MSAVCVCVLQTALRSAGGWDARARHTCTGAARCRAVSSAPVACRRTVCIPNTSATVTPTAKSGTTHTHMTVSSTSGSYYNPKPRLFKENEAYFQEHWDGFVHCSIFFMAVTDIQTLWILKTDMHWDVFVFQTVCLI